MKSKKHRGAPTAGENTPGTDTDDIYLPVCCGEFGLRQAAGFRDLWEATWSQDRRVRDEKARDTIPSRTEGNARKTEKDSSEE